MAIVNPLSHLSKYQIILGSGSPRRHFLLKELGLDFSIRTADLEEAFPTNLQAEQIALYLCKLKADSFTDLRENELLITADTIVWLENEVLNKPRDKKEAETMLSNLSGKMHQVFTGVCIRQKEFEKVFFSETKVYFKKFEAQEIEYYVENYEPFDKAGAYGAQEWLGYIGIDKIEGSYFNVMGLPLRELYAELKKIPLI